MDDFGMGSVGSGMDGMRMDGRANGFLHDKLPVRRLARPVSIITTHLGDIRLWFSFFFFEVAMVSEL